MPIVATVVDIQRKCQLTIQRDGYSRTGRYDCNLTDEFSQLVSEGAARTGTMAGESAVMLSYNAPSGHRIHNATMRLSGREPWFDALSDGDQVTIRVHKTDVSKVWAY